MFQTVKAAVRKRQHLQFTEDTVEETVWLEVLRGDVILKIIPFWLEPQLCSGWEFP
jgi:hypothetical protein